MQWLPKTHPRPSRSRYMFNLFSGVLFMCAYLVRHLVKPSVNITTHLWCCHRGISVARIHLVESSQCGLSDLDKKPLCPNPCCKCNIYYWVLFSDKLLICLVCHSSQFSCKIILNIWFTNNKNWSSNWCLNKSTEDAATTWLGKMF